MHLAPSVFVQVTFLSFKYLISFSGICIIYLPRSDSIAPSLRVRRQSRAGANDNKHRYQHRIQKAGATSAKTQEPWRYQQPSAENQVYPFFPHPERGEGCDREHGYRKTDNVIVQYCGTAGIMSDDPGRHEQPYSQKQVHPVFPLLFFYVAPPFEFHPTTGESAGWATLGECITTFGDLPASSWFRCGRTMIRRLLISWASGRIE